MNLYVGIEVMGLLALRLRNPKEAPKAGRMMIGVLTLLYSVSLTLALSLDPWDAIKAKQSPFVSSLHNLDDYRLYCLGSPYAG